MTYLILILSVWLGYFLGKVFTKPIQKSTRLLLAFSGAFLLGVVVLNLFPEIFANQNKVSGVFFLLGILLQIVLDFFSGGVEHGHLHHHQKQFPWLVFASLCLHAFIEGIPLQSLDSLSIGIAIHKLPIAIIFTIFLLSSRASVLLQITCIGIFSIMSPLGGWFGSHMDILHEHLLYIQALVAGIILHVSTTLILESSEHHRFNLSKILVIIAGVVLAYLI